MIENKEGIDSSKIVLDDSGRFELTDEQLERISGGLDLGNATNATKKSEVCRIQTSPKGCSMKM